MMSFQERVMAKVRYLEQQVYTYQAESNTLRAQLAARDAELAALREALEDLFDGVVSGVSQYRTDAAVRTQSFLENPAPRAAQLAAVLKAVGETLGDFRKWQRTTKDGRDIQQVLQPLYAAWYAANPPEEGLA